MLDTVARGSQAVAVRIRRILLLLAVSACGGTETNGAADAAVDAPPDVSPDAPRVWCDTMLGPSGQDASVLCDPGQICGNSGGIPGSWCCYPTPGEANYCP